MAESMRERLIDLLKRASDEHHEYEESVLKGVYDQEWDLWYASWLVGHGVNDVLNSSVTGADLATLLKDINTQHEGSDKSRDWATYTADQLIQIAPGAPRTN